MNSKHQESANNPPTMRQFKHAAGHGVFRSEKMILCQLFLQSNVAFNATSKLGDLGIFEFRDLNGNINAFQRSFVPEIRRLEDISRKLVYLNEQLIAANIEKKKPLQEPIIQGIRETVAIETSIEEFDREIREINEKMLALRLKEFHLVEMSRILSITHHISETRRNSSFYNINSFQDRMDFSANDFPEQFEMDMVINGDGGGKRGAGYRNRRQSQQQDCNKIFTLTGFVRAEKVLPFQKVLWRVCGHNALAQFYEIEEPIDDVRTNELVQKKAFLIMCQGNKLYEKIRKICDAFHATQYVLPDQDDEYRKMYRDVKKELDDMEIVIGQTRQQKMNTLLAMAEPENFQTWVIQVTKLRAIFSMMNLFQKTERGFLAEGWCARSDYPLLSHMIDTIHQQAEIGGQACLEIVQTDCEPPTYFRSNRFTHGFQNIVDSYGVAKYREMNPAPYTVITFPFLFAMMFADAGHGLLMMLFGLWMVLCERKLHGKSNNEIWLTFFGGRYIIMLMGAFSIYTGSIYNDVFAKGYNLFGTAFEHRFNMTEQPIGELTYLSKSTDYNYPYSIDPSWQISENKILFLNSFKMKLSVIVGVAQMFFGVMISLVNHINQRDIISVCFVWVPQIIFLLSLFGYMNVLIFAKWLIKWNPQMAPSILIDFINMFLIKYPDEPAYLRPWFKHKQILQTFLLMLALIQVPIMLVIKPSIEVFLRNRNHGRRDFVGNVESQQQQQQQQQHEHAHAHAQQQQDTVDTGNSAGSQPSDTATTSTKHEESVGDIYIHQAIHTIEYCLGSISHTASYLRLWALSLAHSQLSEVLWSMVMTKGFASSSSNVAIRAVITYFAFGMWAVLTVAILIVMEGLSAFLHALRLHWVEFQSKFYAGTGVQFRPFNIKQIMEETNILAEKSL